MLVYEAVEIFDPDAFVLPQVRRRVFLPSVLVAPLREPLGGFGKVRVIQ